MNRSTINVSLNFSPRLSSKESIRVRTKCIRHRTKEIVTFVNRAGKINRRKWLGRYVCKEGSLLSWSGNGGGRVEGDREIISQSVPGQD